MLVINLFYILSIFLPIMSIIFLIVSIKNKDITVYKNIRMIGIVYIIYMFLNFYGLAVKLHLDIGLELIILFPLQIMGVIIYILSICICSIKINKINRQNISNNNSKTYLLSVVMILLPIFILVITVVKEITLLNTSDLILIYEDRENGGFGDGETLIYTIKQNRCKEVSIGASFGGYTVKNFFIKSPQVLKEYKYKIKYDSVDSNYEYVIENINYYSRKDLNFNEINKNELEYIILDIKKAYNPTNEVYISYLKESNYYVIESRDLDSVFIYEGKKCIQKINLSGNIEIDEAFCFKY